MWFIIPQRRLLHETIDEILRLFKNPGTDGEKEAARQAYLRLTGVGLSVLDVKGSDVKSTCDDHPDRILGCKRCEQAQRNWYEIKARQHLKRPKIY